MQTLVLVVEYDGTNFSGWQIQPNGRTIQETLQKAYFELTGESINIIGSGRTDAGVHATGQVASAKISLPKIPNEKLSIAINSILPNDIRIVNAVYSELPIHARFDATARKYKYRLSKTVSVFERNFISEYKIPFDTDRLFEISRIFIGNIDFTTFSKINPDIKNNTCNVTESYWEFEDNLTLRYNIKANHFLYGMVRAIVGVMLDYARGKRSLNEILRAIDMKNRNLSSGFAPAEGLYLTRVYYPNEIEKIIYTS